LCVGKVEIEGKNQIYWKWRFINVKRGHNLN
jgi:hypothetical protein